MRRIEMPWQPGRSLILFMVLLLLCIIVSNLAPKSIIMGLSISVIDHNSDSQNDLTHGILQIYNELHF